MSNSVDDFGPDPKLAALLAQWEADTKVESKSNNDFVVYLKNGKYALKLVLPEDRDLSKFYGTYETTFTDKKTGDSKLQKNHMITAVILRAKIEGDEEAGKSLTNKEAVRFIRLTPTALRAFFPQISAYSDVLDDDKIVCDLFNDVGPIVDVQVFTKANGFPDYTVVGNTKLKYDSSKAVLPTISMDEAIANEVERSNKPKDTLPFVTSPKTSEPEW